MSGRRCSTGRRLSPYFLDRMFALAELPAVTDVRGYGLLAAFDLAPDGDAGAPGYPVPEAAVRERPADQVDRRYRHRRAALIAEHSHIDEIADILDRMLADI